MRYQTCEAETRSLCFSGRCFVMAGWWPYRREGVRGCRSWLRSRRTVRGVAGITRRKGKYSYHKAPSTSGRELTQLTGLCRGRTHIPMALCVAPAPWRFAATMKTGNVYRQAAGPRNGRLAIECDVQRAVGPFWAGRRFQHSTPHTWGREPRGYLCLRQRLRQWHIHVSHWWPPGWGVVARWQAFPNCIQDAACHR